jgi:hypothetical protein
MGGQFMGRRISKEIINLGTAGQIERGGNELPPRATVRFEAEATVSSIKHKFLEDGTVEESTILTLIADSFGVVSIAKAAEQPELPLTATQPDGPVTPQETDQVAAEMGLKGPLLVGCEACGHGRGDHGPGTDGEAHSGLCLVPFCWCMQYVPFQEPPAEEALEPVTVEELDHEVAVGAAVVEPAPVEMAEPMPTDDQVTTGAVDVKQEPAPRRGRRRHLQAVGTPA